MRRPRLETLIRAALRYEGVLDWALERPEIDALHRQVQVGQVDAVRPHLPGGQGKGPVVVPAGQGHGHPRTHRFSRRYDAAVVTGSANVI